MILHLFSHQSTIYILLDNHLLGRMWKSWTRNSKFEKSNHYLVHHLELGLRIKILTPQFLQEQHFVVCLFPLSWFSYANLSSILSLVWGLWHGLTWPCDFTPRLTLHDAFQVCSLTCCTCKCTRVSLLLTFSTLSTHTFHNCIISELTECLQIMLLPDFVHFISSSEATPAFLLYANPFSFIKTQLIWPRSPLSFKTGMSFPSCIITVLIFGNILNVSSFTCLPLEFKLLPEE